MSRSFLTNLNLNKNQLLNAAIQPLSQAPQNPTVGQIYFDTGISTLRQWTGSSWIDYLSSADGNQFIEAVDANFSVANQTLSLSNTVTVHSTVNVGGENLDDGALRIKGIAGNTVFDVNANTQITTMTGTLSAISGVGSGKVQLDGNAVTAAFIDLNNNYIGDIAVSDNNLKVRAAANNLLLNSDVGDIVLHADGSVISDNNITTSGTQNITAGNNLYAGAAIYAGGQDWGTDGSLHIQDGSGNTTFYVAAYNGAASTEVHGTQTFYTGVNDGGTQYGVVSYDTGKNLVLDGSYNDVIIKSNSGFAYIGDNNSTATRIATQAYVDSVAQGLNVKESVRAATAVAGNLASDFEAGDVVGGVTLVAGDRILIKNQATATENGIYVVNNSGAPTRAVDADPVSTELDKGSYVLVTDGTYAATGWIVTAYAAGATTWTQFSAANEYSAGNGIDISNNVVSVKLDSDSLAESGSGLKVNLAANGGLDNDGGLYVVTGTGLTVNGSNQLTFASGYGVRKYAANNGALTASGGSVTWAVTHDFGTRDVTVQLIDLSDYSQVEVDVVRTSTSVVTLSWVSGNVNADSYRVVVVG